MKLTSRQVSFLKGLAHEKKAVILLGKNGITDSVIKETASALLIHELIKVRLAAEDKEGLENEAEAIATRTSSSLVERRGKIAILYRKHPDLPKITLPKEPKKKASANSEAEG